MIYKKLEGHKPKIGLNWDRNKHTKIYLGLVIPIWLTRRKTYLEFDTGDFVSSLLITLLYFRLRINSEGRIYTSISKFPKALKKELILTKEEMEEKRNAS